MSKIHVRTFSYVERIIDIVQKRSIDDFFAKVLTDYGAAVLAANQSQREGQVTALKAYRDEMRDACSHFQDTSDVEERLTAILESVSPHPPRTLPDDECEELTHATAALQQSYSGITACAEKPSQVVDSGAAGPTRTGDLLITNQGAETAETLGNQQDTATPAPAEGAKVAQGESITCEGVTAGLRPPADRIRHVLNFAATHALAALAELEADAEIGRDWRADSSLAKWFPSTAREMDELRANLAEYEQAPTVAVVEGKYGLNLAYRYPFSDKPPPIGTELIARPTRKDGAP